MKGIDVFSRFWGNAEERKKFKYLEVRVASSLHLKKCSGGLSVLGSKYSGGLSRCEPYVRISIEHFSSLILQFSMQGGIFDVKSIFDIKVSVFHVNLFSFILTF